ncbi:unnamed protein product [Hyaloperonospora brassicae]|uniref:Serine aminopeptidase S33 domain-containing protein n=1 Tax=Hyaloperonospora brassicae TaxID=162125 RepID=A0AAV0TRI0_HYABA|nr:unnamed protein product [Hyaloperonospora brassicae]
MATRARVNSSLRAQHMPSHFRHIEGTFTNARGQNLSYLALFPPLDAPLRAFVLYLHGIGDHSRRYFHLYERLCSSGFGVFAYDLVSHGASDSDRHGLRAHSAKFQHFVDDTNEFVALVKSQLIMQLGLGSYALADAPPFLLSGMSYGTLVGLHTILSGQHTFHGLVLVAPALLVEMTTILRIQAVFARPLSTLVPKARIVPGVNGAFLCRDQAYLDDFRADPLTVSEPVTARMGAETLKAMKALETDRRVQAPDSVLATVPILMMMGSNDKVTSLALAQVFFQRLATRDKEFKVFNEFYHALFDDPEHDAVFDYLENWLVQRFPLVPRRSNEAVDTEFQGGEETGGVATGAEGVDAKVLESKSSVTAETVDDAAQATLTSVEVKEERATADVLATDGLRAETAEAFVALTAESTATTDELASAKVEHDDDTAGVSNTSEKDESALGTVTTIESNGNMAQVVATKVSAYGSSEARKTGA